MKYILIVFGFFFYMDFSVAQCYVTNNAFKSGEVVRYTVSYNWGFIWVNAGEVEFSVDSVLLNKQWVYHFKSYGKSFPEYDWIFKVRDYYESYSAISPLKPLIFKRKNYEGGSVVNNAYLFDYDRKKIISETENSKKPYRKDTLSLKDCTHDLLTAIYYARNIDFHKYKENDKIPLNLIIDGEYYSLYMRYLGRDTIKNRNNKVYTCIKFTAMLVEGTMFNEGENLTVWVTDDQNRIPVYIEAKILVGKVKAYMVSATGLLHSM